MSRHRARHQPSPARFRVARDEAPFVAVAVIVVGGFGYLAAAPAHWLRGVLAVAAGLLLAGVLRAALKTARVGLLAVRSRGFDVVWYLATGAAIIALGLAVPG
ncbi:MAG: DUF3017 domain-containing protein [Actinomycetia bacterium]|nr:DUF3017 domain-containing protein [Actinomycetes bacterium]